MTISRRSTLPAALGVAAIGGAAWFGAASRSTPDAPATSVASASPAGTTSRAADGTKVDWPITRCGTYSGKGCAPTNRRVDLQRPTFSNPTKITNPLFPISALNSVVLLGEVDGKAFRSETTLMPGSHRVVVDGKPIEVVVSQYTAYLGGRLDEVAIDRYAQADDGSVWYLGEDVFDYRNGTVAITEGTWLAGRNGPEAMIMPAHPKVGDVSRPENITGVVFEEVEVKAVDRTVEGPRGPINGVVRMSELHLDGSYSDKVFAPGYGEFDTSTEADTEALALAVPTDAIREPMPQELRRMSTSALGILENARLDDWEAAKPTLARMTELWRGLQGTHYPPRVVAAMNQATAALSKAVTAEDVAGASQAAIDVAQSTLDLELLYTGNFEADRFHLHAQQLRVHAAAKDAGGVNSEVATMEWIRDRLAGSVGASQFAELNAGLQALRAAAAAGNLGHAADLAARMAAALRG